MTTPTTSRRLRALACAAILVAGLASCGKDTDDNPQANSANDSATGQAADTSSANPKPAATSGSDQDQIRALVANVQQAFKDGDGQAVCNSLAMVGQRDLAYYGRLTNLPGSCAEIAASIAKRNQALQDKQPPAHVLKVQVNGNKAVALIRLSDSPPARQRYTKINGTWKIQSFRIGEAAGGQPAP